MERKLTAILSADVEGYSRLMGEDEEATIRTLNSYRQVMATLIPMHRGRIVDSPGDNLLVEFGSVVDAVKCAVVIQSTLRLENADLPQNRRMEFRIGINLGDVIVDGERIYGDGVNIAARMEGLAEGGGICVSGMVFEQVKGKVSVGFEDLGPQQVKNIAEPIRAYRAVLDQGTPSARPQQKIEIPRQALQETSNLYDELMARLSPLLYRGIEDVLHRHKRTLKWGGNFEFNVSAPIKGIYRIVGSTLPAEHPLRGYETKTGDSFFHEKKAAGYFPTSWRQPESDRNRPVFDLAGNLLGEIPTSPITDRWRMPGEIKWLYCRPIFEKSTATPWSNRVVGIFNVHSPVDDSASLFKSAEFQNLVDTVAAEVSPYLDAIQVLMGEEKP